MQAANSHPLTVYGTGGQSRAFIHQMILLNAYELPLKMLLKMLQKFRIMNQVSEVQRVRDLALLISEKFGVEINNVDNPRKELSENDLEVSNNFLNLGFKPTLLAEGLIDDVNSIASQLTANFKRDSFKFSQVVKNTLTLIVTSYNSLEYVSTFQRFLKNSAKLFEEIIIIDDCSDDGSYEQLQKIEEIYSLRLLRTKKNSGRPSEPRNIGIRNAKSSRIVFLDIDDYIPKDYLCF